MGWGLKMLNEVEWIANNLRKQTQKSLLAKKSIAVYGCGDGGRLVLEALRMLNLEQNIVCFLDNKNSYYIDRELYGYKVYSMEEKCNELDYILVAAKNAHCEVYEILKRKVKNKNAPVIIDSFELYNSEDDYVKYVKYLESRVKECGSVYKALPEDTFSWRGDETRVIAWYLPQYYAIDYNDRFHGLGFTEWTNSSNAFPQYTGHYQPHIPYDVGYYDLTNKKTIKRQSELASYFGVYGWAIHYYWFDENTQFLDTPLKILFENKDIDIHYMINWATENWELEWDESYKKVDLKDSFIKQTLPKDPQKFMNKIIPIMRDKRYIKINGKPVFSVYHISVFEKDEFRNTMESFRKIAVEEGFPGLYIMLSTGCGTNSFDCKEWGGDALVEYQPNYMCTHKDYKRVFPEGYINPNFNGKIYDISTYLKNKSYLGSHLSEKYFRCAVTGWDNTARKGQSGARIIVGNTPDEMKLWLKDLIKESKKIHSKEEDYVFLSSWNEWAEGSHLEPDMKCGYAWLLAVREALEGK